jgi:hypothetical protein
MIRDLKLSDLVILEKDDLPNLFNGPFKLIKSIEKDGELIGSFWVRLTAEVSILLRPEVSNLTKARAIKELGNFLYDKIPEQLGISEGIITFDDGKYDPIYIEFLKKHFKFEDIKTLRLRRNDG